MTGLADRKFIFYSKKENLNYPYRVKDAIIDGVKSHPLLCCLYVN